MYHFLEGMLRNGNRVLANSLEEFYKPSDNSSWPLMVIFAMLQTDCPPYFSNISSMQQ